MSQQILISVGIPVYNAEKTISRCLESILYQTYSNLEIVISDNNSTDRTFEICKSYSEMDSRIILIRQEVNIGPAGNFATVFENSHGTYFCWVASDDYRSQDFVELNHDFLENNQSAAASTSPHEFLVNSTELIRGRAMSLCGILDSRVENFLQNPWNSHALFYSLYRRESIMDFPKLGENFFGWDWAIIFHTLLHGNMHRIEKGLIYLQSGGQSDRTNALRMSGVSGLKYLSPLVDFSHFVLISIFKIQPFLCLRVVKLLSILSFKIFRYEYFLVKHLIKLKLKRKFKYNFGK